MLEKLHGTCNLLFLYNCVVVKISHRDGADRGSKPGTLNPVESQLLSTEPQQLARDI